MFNPKNFKAPVQKPYEAAIAERGLKVIIHAIRPGTERTAIRFHFENEYDGGHFEPKVPINKGEIPYAYCKRVGWI